MHLLTHGNTSQRACSRRICIYTLISFVQPPSIDRCPLHVVASPFLSNSHCTCTHEYTQTCLAVAAMPVVFYAFPIIPVQSNFAYFFLNAAVRSALCRNSIRRGRRHRRGSRSSMFPMISAAKKLFYFCNRKGWAKRRVKEGRVVISESTFV